MVRKRRCPALPRVGLVNPGSGVCLPTAHYWIIEGQGRALSTAVCKHCGARAEFLNSFNLNQVRALYRRKKAAILTDASTDPELVELITEVENEELNQGKACRGPEV